MSFLWYDLETFGQCPRRSRIAQFAAQRTDEALNPIEDPVVLFCRPALDLLPSPGACMVTGLSPQSVLERGMPESECFGRIDAIMREAGTCSVGWNTLRFDDNFIRFGLYRNFLDPYAREWANGNSRWDLLDYARLAHALRPDGIEWPRREDGHTSFRLEHLAAANGITHLSAHDALSDVEATIGMARRFRAAQPKLWAYSLGLRDKQRALHMLDPVRGEPLLHVSGRFPASRGCAGIVMPLAEHPSNRNQIIVFELHDDPQRLLDLDAAQIAARVFVRQEALGDEPRIALKLVHANRCPALVELRHVRDEELARLGIDRDLCLRHAEVLRHRPALAEKLRELFTGTMTPATDCDHALYDALPDRRDARLHQQIRRSAPSALRECSGRFNDPRGDEMLFRFRSRNWPETLDAGEALRWRDYRRRRLEGDGTLSELSLAQYFAELQQLRGEVDPSRHPLLDALDAWGQRVAAYP